MEWPSSTWASASVCFILVNIPEFYMHILQIAYVRGLLSSQFGGTGESYLKILCPANSLGMMQFNGPVLL